MAGTGAGYNIPISVSYARTDTTNPILDAYTTFNFSSPWGSGGSNDLSGRNTADATATSSAAEGNAAAATNSAQSVNQGGSAAAAGISKYWLYGAGAAIVILGFLLWQNSRR